MTTLLYKCDKWKRVGPSCKGSYRRKATSVHCSWIPWTAQALYGHRWRLKQKLHSQRGLPPGHYLDWFSRWQFFGLLGSTSHSHIQHLQQQIHRAPAAAEKSSAPYPYHRNHRKHPTSSFNKGKHLVWVGLEIPGIFLRSHILSPSQRNVSWHGPHPQARPWATSAMGMGKCGTMALNTRQHTCNDRET